MNTPAERGEHRGGIRGISAACRGCGRPRPRRCRRQERSRADADRRQPEPWRAQGAAHEPRASRRAAPTRRCRRHRRRTKTRGAQQFGPARRGRGEHDRHRRPMIHFDDMQGLGTLPALVLPALLARAPLTPEKVTFVWGLAVGAGHRARDDGDPGRHGPDGPHDRPGVGARSGALAGADSVARAATARTRARCNRSSSSLTGKVPPA